MTADQFSVARDRERPAGQIALNFIASFLNEEGPLAFGFDPFRKDWDLEAMTHADDRTDNRLGMAVVIQVGNKGAVDLDLVECEGVQI